MAGPMMPGSSAATGGGSASATLCRRHPLSADARRFRQSHQCFINHGARLPGRVKREAIACFYGGDTGAGFAAPDVRPLEQGMRQTDVAIVGAGLAGSLAATMLGRAGYSAVLI